MAQDVVTAREVAAPAEVSLRFQDAQRICELLNDALLKEGYLRTDYSKSAQSMFQLAWAVASHKQSTQVTVYHLAYALVIDNREGGERLAAFLESDVHRFAGGCILQTLPLGILSGESEVLPPAIDTVRWLGEAAALARLEGNQSELRPEHLVRAVLGGAVPAPVRSALRKAARTGNMRLNTVLGPRPLPDTASPRDVIQHIEQVESRDAGKSDPDIASVIKFLEDFDQRISEDVDHQKQALGRIEAALPRPPSTARLAAAIFAVLTLGVAAGLLLTFRQPGVAASQAVLTSAK